MERSTKKHCVNSVAKTATYLTNAVVGSVNDDEIVDGERLAHENENDALDDPADRLARGERKREDQRAENHHEVLEFVFEYLSCDEAHADPEDR